MSKSLDFNTFIKNYDIAVFDMDGVITSEQIYWDAAALTAYEYINSELYFGNEKPDAMKMYENLKDIRSEVFQNDRMISLCKNAGINSNWDLAYVTIGLYLEFANAKNSVSYLEKCPGLKELYDRVAENFSKKTAWPKEECVRKKKLWNEIVSCFQEWYMGYDEYIKRYSALPALEGKPFMGKNEKPFLNPDRLYEFLSELKSNGVSLGIATGRNTFEIETPLKSWGIYDLFDKNRVVTYDTVQNAEATLSGKCRRVSLVKPAPYCFLKSALGVDFSDEKIISGDYEIKERVLAVGDAGADIFAAQSAGFDFLAVLTGVRGKDAREFFEENKATYINDNLLDVFK